MNILCRDNNRFDGSPNLESKYFASVKVTWIIVIKDNKHMLSLDYAKKARFPIVARCIFDDFL